MSEVGRPTLYRPEYCENLIEHMRQGLSFESFGAIIGTSRRVLYDWKDKHAEFLHAMELGAELSFLFWEKLGIDNILNESESLPNVGSKSKSLNSAVYNFIMKNKFAYRDKQPGEETPTAIVNNNNVSLTDEQLLLLSKSARTK